MYEDNLPTTEQAESMVLDRLSPDDRSDLAVAVRTNLKEILFSMIQAAKGVYVEKTVIKKGMEITVPVYQEEPNIEAAQYLLNQLMGKPKETSVDLHLKQNIIVQNEIKVSRMSEARDA